MNHDNNDDRAKNETIDLRDTMVIIEHILHTLNDVVLLSNLFEVEIRKIKLLNKHLILLSNITCFAINFISDYIFAQVLLKLKRLHHSENA